MLAFHPYADLFPLIEGDQFAELVADIKANDLRERIVVLDGAILDGRNRYRAGLVAGLLDDDDGPDRTKYFVRFVPAVDGDPLTFVVSKNLKRRHLNESQRSFIAAKIANMPAHRPADKSANLQTSQAAAAALVNVSPRSVASAAKVHAKAEPEVQRAVERGTLPVSTAADLADLPAERQREIVAADKPDLARHARNEIKKGRRDEREAELGEAQLATPEGKFGVIVEDYEWDHVTWSEAGKDRHAGNHYPTSRDAHTAAEIVERTKDRLACAADHCFLAMWATIPHLAIAIDVMRMRGFEYKSHQVWGKEHFITGYWFRGKHEVLLVGVKGKVPCPAMGTQDASFFVAPSGEHSEKPDCVMAMIERYFPTLPKLELNSRRARPGWVVWGLDAGHADNSGATIPHDPDAGEVIDKEAAPIPESGVGDDVGDVRGESSPPLLPVIPPIDDGLDLPDLLRRKPPLTEPRGAPS